MICPSEPAVMKAGGAEGDGCDRTGVFRVGGCVKGSRDGRIGWKRFCSVVGGGGRRGESRQKSQFNSSN